MKQPFGRGRSAVLSTLLTCSLVACGGGDGAPSSRTVVAVADTLTIAPGQSGNLLANDTLDGGSVTAGTPGNVSFSVTTGTPPAGVIVTDGSVAVAANALPGTYSFSYQICETANSANCASAAVQITVPPSAIVAAADSFNLPVGSSGDVLANDTLAGAAASATTVVATATTTPLPAGITLSAGGLVSVGTGAIAGTYPLNYSICQTLVPTNCATSTVTVTVPAMGLLTGRAVDSATGLGVNGVTVRAGSATATTDASGNFSMPNVPTGDRVTVVFDSATHAESARVAAVQATGSTDVQVRLVRVAATAVVDVATGGTVTVASTTAQVTLPANGVQRADGSVPTGNMTVDVTPIDPASDSAVMPGDFTTLVSGTPTPIESFGALNVRLTDASGAPLNLRAGQTATLRIPMTSRNASVPTTIPLFYFDNASGRWIQEGTATLAGNGANPYYEGTVGHFSTWNADQIYNTVRISGCVADAAGVRIGGAFVASDGVDYTGTTSTVADNNGNFVLAIRKDSAAAVTGLSGDKLTNTLRVGPYSADTDLPNCLALGQAGAGITMKLTWGQQPDDLDSHLFAPDGSHVYFGNKGNLVATPFANLDVDDTSSYGPEVVTVTRLMVGTYKYSIRNYSGYSNGSISASGAHVELNIPGRAVELFAPPTGESSSTNWWNLFELDVDASCNVSVRRVGTFTSTSPSAPSAAPVYCTVH